VAALAVIGNDLYAGGSFTTAGTNSASRIAKWNGSSWSALGLGVNTTVWALAASGSDLYAAGNFTRAGTNTQVARIAKWDGSDWSALGSGVNNSVNALAAAGGYLYVGGAFTMAGGKVSVYVAQAKIATPGNFISTFLSGGDFVARILGAPGAEYTIESTPGVSPANWQKKVNLFAPAEDQGLGVGVFEFNAGAAAAPQQLFRTVWPAY